MRFKRRSSGIPLALLLAIAASLASAAASAGSGARFPGRTWDKAIRPEDLGYSSGKLAAAKAYSQTIKTAAVMVVVRGVIVDEWGDVAKKYLTHSTRKSFLSALYGKYVRSGVIDLDKTLADLGIDDEPPLTPEEKQATVRDCLKARSGVFHTSEAGSITVPDGPWCSAGAVASVAWRHSPPPARYFTNTQAASQLS